MSTDLVTAALQRLARGKRLPKTQLEELANDHLITIGEDGTITITHAGIDRLNRKDTH
ncbi:hypothetical protein ACUY2E_10385 [Corynebacterium confusum]